jgi:4'-phosphopantetheinyl transferase
MPMPRASCDVWLADVAQLHPAHRDLLSRAELSRTERLRRTADRARSLLGAVLLRLAVSEHLGCAPQSVVVDRTCRTCGAHHGKPSVGHGLHVSVAHSGNVVLVAVSRAAEVGVDVEWVAGSRLSAADRPRLLHAVCAEDEQADITTDRDLLVCWTRKEAIVKATGDGLSVPLVDLSLTAPDAPPELISWAGRDRPPCVLADLALPAGYVGALAVLAAGPLDVTVRCADSLLEHVRPTAVLSMKEGRIA